MNSYLNQILATIRSRNEAMKATLGPNDADRLADQRPDRPRSFTSAIAAASDKTMIIAEIKRASPSRGAINLDIDPASLAREYELGGAAAIAVVTEQKYYRGSVTDMQEVRESVQLPVLRNDFIIDPYQVSRSFGTGADAIQVIVPAVEDDAVLHQIFDTAARLRLDVLTEVYSEEDAKRVLEIGKDSPNALRLVGINCANWDNVKIDLDRPARLAPIFPESTTLISHSGIRSRADIDRVRASSPRITRFLVGEALVRATYPADFLSELLKDAPKE